MNLSDLSLSIFAHVRWCAALRASLRSCSLSITAFSANSFSPMYEKIERFSTDQIDKGPGSRDLRSE